MASDIEYGKFNHRNVPPVCLRVASEDDLWNSHPLTNLLRDIVSNNQYQNPLYPSRPPAGEVKQRPLSRTMTLLVLERIAGINRSRSFESHHPLILALSSDLDKFLLVWKMCVFRGGDLLNLSHGISGC